MNVAISERMKPIETDIAAPLTARDYKGVRNQEYGTVVMLYEDKANCETEG